MALVETHCPNCGKKIFLDLEEIVSESSSRPITCSQCGNKFIFGFDADAFPINDSPINDSPLNGEDGSEGGEKPLSGSQKNHNGKRTTLVKKLIVKKIKKEKPKANKTVFIIEDSTLTREQVADIFSEFVSNVVTFKNAEEGLKAMESQRPDLLIVDLHLPNMSGIDFINSARKFIEPDKIIIFTASQDIYLDIFDQDMAGVSLIQKTGSESFEDLKDKASMIMQIE